MNVMKYSQLLPCSDEILEYHKTMENLGQSSLIAKPYVVLVFYISSTTLNVDFFLVCFDNVQHMKMQINNV